MKLLLTGGSGRLGSELKSLLGSDRASGSDVELVAPSRAELDVTDARSFLTLTSELRPDVIVNAAAYTDVAGAEREREACWRVNVEGTRNAAAAAANNGAKLVHISSDYVFWGDSGSYKEDDIVGPVRNYYALTKLVAEESARAAPDRLVIRTSFRPRRWVHPSAFADLYTSQDYVDVIAPEIVTALLHHLEVPYPTLHIATERKSVLDLARRRAPDVRSGLRSDAPVALPEDVSLDSSRWRELKRSWGLTS